MPGQPVSLTGKLGSSAKRAFSQEWLLSGKSQAVERCGRGPPPGPGRALTLNCMCAGLWNSASGELEKRVRHGSDIGRGLRGSRSASASANASNEPRSAPGADDRSRCSPAPPRTVADCARTRRSRPDRAPAESVQFFRTKTAMPRFRAPGIAAACYRRRYWVASAPASCVPG